MYDSESAKPVSYSRSVMTELMIPIHASIEGKVYGGSLLAMMDKLAIACAAKHVGGYCATAAVEEVNFLHPVELGELVTFMASVNYVGNTSLIVGVRGESLNLKTGTTRHINTSYFTIVAKDEFGRPRQSPKLILENTEDVRRFLEAMLRRQMRLVNEVDFEKRAQTLDLLKELGQLKRERCVINFEL